nr:retrovirus-related Pol polyprotein from transposon TNT 1-94 [Tanacetum cinerariifolium]
MTIHVLLVSKANNTEPLNRMLVTKPHNKTPYELLHGRLPSIGFMRPFGCPITILNTLDHLGKFQGKVDEGFLVGYSVCRHKKAKEEVTHTYVLFLVLSDGSTNSQNKNKDALIDEKEHDDDIQNSNGVNAASSSVSTAGQNFINNTNDFSATGPSNTTASPTVANSSSQDASIFSHDSDMPNLEDLTHSDDADDVGAEADINNLESIISVSPIPTTRIHKDHPTSQIIGDMSSTTQTKSMAKAVRDQ